MRPDMSRLSTARSFQFNGGERKLFTRGQMPANDELLPHRQSTRSATAHQTYLSITKLGPVVKWLRQQAGRPWSAVYSELRSAFNRHNGAHQYILERVLRQVDIHNVFFDDDGFACVPSSWSACSFKVDGLYVNPKSGLLCYQELERMSNARRRAKRASEAPVHKVQVSPTLQLREVDGLWYWVELAPLTPPEYAVTPERVLPSGTVIPGYRILVRSSVCRDVLTGHAYTDVDLAHYERAALLREYGAENFYAKHKRQASHKDVCRYLPQQRLSA